VALTQYYGTGRRKTATARVYLRPGSGAITVNHREFNQFFPTEALRTQIQQAFVVTEMTGRYDVLAIVSGGGVAGQAGALRLGIARALITSDPDDRPALKKAGFLTRDARVKESKKYGLKKARKAPQYSKR